MQLILLSKIEIPPSIRPRRIIDFARYIQKINWNCDDGIGDKPIISLCFKREKEWNFKMYPEEADINFVEKFRIDRVFQRRSKTEREFKTETGKLQVVLTITL